VKLKEPVYIIGCPRSGTTLLFTILRAAKEFWSSHSESHYVWSYFVPDPRDEMFSIYLTEKDYKNGDEKIIEKAYLGRVFRNSVFREFTKYAFYNKYRKIFFPFYKLWRMFFTFIRLNFGGKIRVLDKTPPNTFRVGFLNKAFPDAKFIYLTRDGITNTSSLIEGWKSTGRFSFKFREFYDFNKDIKIKGYNGKVWKFTNPPGWEAYLNKSLEEVCAFQWASAHEKAQEALKQMDSSRYITVKYEELIANPSKIIKEICDFLGVEYNDAIKKQCESLPVVSTDSKPNPKKWLKNKDLIANVTHLLDPMQKTLNYPTATETLAELDPQLEKTQ
jgi:hypothetical protein